MSLINTVIKNGYCIGCGVCTVHDDSPFEVARNEFGMREAKLKSEPVLSDLTDHYEKVCPFGDKAPNETELGSMLFPDAPKQEKFTGRYWKGFAGSTMDSDLRAKASSGGIARWLSQKLLSEKVIDNVIHVVSTPNTGGEPLFKYEIVNDAEEIKNAASSAYYPTSMDGVLKQLLSTEGTFLVTGVPCFIKSLRLLSLENPEVKSKIKYTVGIVCGHMKTEAYAESIAWQMGVLPQEMKSINFRGKNGGKKASVKLNIVESKDNTTHQQTTGKLFGTGYSVGMFKPKACDFCDDVLAETADISFGDAWLEKYVNDVRGNSLVVVRNKELLGILESAVEEKELLLDTLTHNEIIKSQEGGIRHRNEGLECRLLNYKKQKLWVPKKRVQPTWKTKFNRRAHLYNLRHLISQKSHSSFLIAKQQNSFELFKDDMSVSVKKHNLILRKEKSKKLVITKLKSILRGGK